MKKKMGCKARKAIETGATLSVVRISMAFATKQTAFYSPRVTEKENFLKINIGIIVASTISTMAMRQMSAL